MELKIDQDFKELIPPLSADELLNLEQSILAEGCRDAIQTWNGFIVDGHNRYSICSRLNLPFKVEEKEFSSRNDVCIWMIQNQFARRNLSNYVRGVLGLRLEEFFREKAKDNLSITGKRVAEFTNFQGSANSPNLEELETIPKQLSNYERSSLALKLKENQSQKPKIEKIDTREEIAKVSGIGSNTISKIKEIKSSAPVEVLSH